MIFCKPPSAMIRHASFGNLEELVEKTPAWSLNAVQTEPGALHAETLFAKADNLVFINWSIDRNAQFQGVTPKGYRTFSVPALPQKPYLSRRQWIAHDQIALIPESGESVGMVRGGYSAFALSIKEEELEQLSLMTGGLDLTSLSEGRVFTPKPYAMNKLRGLLQSIAGLGKSSELESWFHAASESAKSSLASCLASTVECSGYPPPKSRDRAFTKVLDHMREHLSEIMSVKDLCQVANVSERTLLYIFRERLDTTPKAFLQACRLRKVQSELLNGTVKSVTDAATRWGYWHMGQFAADYKHYFGELPSATFKRSAHLL